VLASSPRLTALPPVDGTAGAPVSLPHAVPVLPAGRAADDPRVRAAAAVLAGADPAETAARAGVDVGQLVRWADALSRGGAQAVGGLGLERPGEGPWASRVPVEDFLTVVAHELRSPLTAARTGLKVLADGEIDEDVRAQVARTVLDRLHELHQLTCDLDDAVAVASGRAALRPERVDLTAVTADACAHAGVGRPADPPAWVSADPGRTAVVVSTLLRHAARYADPVDTNVIVRTLTDAVLLTVVVSGVVVSPQHAGAALEPFSAAAGADGNGLALYVVRTLVVASGGMVGVAGDAERDVTAFWVRLPPAPGRAHEPVRGRPVPLPRKDLP
jgi:signal transduction histidine kinase